MVRSFQRDELLFDPRNLTVLIVDDQDPIRKALKRIVQGLEFGSIVDCSDGDDALKHLKKIPVDLVILDLFMRKVSGFQVLEHIRGRDVGCDIPVIVVTGEASKEEIVKVADMGAEDYLLKPFQAIDLERKIIKSLNQFYSPSSLFKTLRKAERLLIAGELESAIEHYEKALQIDPQSARALHGKAISLKNLGEIKAAVTLLDACLSANPRYHKAYGTLADIFLEEKKTQNAIKALKDELEINPRQIKRQIQLAKLLLEKGEFSSAIDRYRLALQDDPKKLSALMGMGEAYAQQKNLDKAMQYFRRARRHHPKNAKILDAVILFATQAQMPKKAENFLKDEKTLNPKRKDTYVTLARFLMKQSRDDEALTVCHELLSQFPDQIEGIKIKVKIHLKKNEFEAAINHLKILANIAPSAAIMTELGNALFHLGDDLNALEALHHSLIMNPHSARCLYLLASLCQRSQQWTKAYILLKKAENFGLNSQLCREPITNALEKIKKRKTLRRAS